MSVEGPEFYQVVIGYSKAYYETLYYDIRLWSDIRSGTPSYTNLVII